MSSSHLPPDERLIARLGAVAREFDPPPPLIYELGHQVFQLRRLDDELVELVADSLLDSHTVRAGAAEVRLLSFESDGVSIELEVSCAGSSSSILGQLVGDGAAADGRAYLQTPAGDAGSVAIDADGRFEFPDVPQTPWRVRVDTAGAPSRTTSWVTL